MPRPKVKLTQNKFVSQSLSSLVPLWALLKPMSSLSCQGSAKSSTDPESSKPAL